MNYNNLCFRCFAEKPASDVPCPKCGHVNTAPQISNNCLRAGTLLKNRYVVGVALGMGGFGITYKCFDTEMGVICAIKEYFPLNFASRDFGGRTVTVNPQKIDRYNTIMKRFVDESRLLKELNHPNIIRVYDAFFANNTAYYVMEYCDGIDLRKYTDGFRKKLTYDDGINIMYQVMKGLRYVHNKGILHRDIAPDNIYITKNKKIKILDFGSARHEMDQLNRELSVIIKAGYAPIEQYGGRDRQGPYTDVYAFGATFYHLFTGVAPVESTQRVAGDSLVPFSRLRPDLPEELKRVIEGSLVLTIGGRIQNFGDMMHMLNMPDENVTTASRRPVSVTPPVSTSQTPVSNTDNAPPRERYNVRASVSQRLIAYMLDVLIYGTAYSVFVLLAMPGNSLAIVIWLLFPVFLTIINMITELLGDATLGKALTGLRIGNTQGERALASNIILRNLIKAFGIIALLFTRDGELLEDRATDSIVYKKQF